MHFAFSLYFRFLHFIIIIIISNNSSFSLIQFGCLLLTTSFRPPMVSRVTHRYPDPLSTGGSSSLGQEEGSHTVVHWTMALQYTQTHTEEGKQEETKTVTMILKTKHPYNFLSVNTSVYPSSPSWDEGRASSTDGSLLT